MAHSEMLNSLIFSSGLVDSVALIGTIPLVNYLDYGELDLNNIKLLSMSECLQNVSPATGKKYADKNTLHIGTCAGWRFHLVTALTAQELEQLLVNFVAQSDVSKIGSMNGWLCSSNRSAEEVRRKMYIYNYSKVAVTIDFLKNLRKWLVVNQKDPNVVLGGIVSSCMKMEPETFFPTLKNSVNNMLILDAHIHVVVQVKSVSKEPCIVAMSKEFQAEFGGMFTQWFHPFGLLEAFSCECKTPTRLCNLIASIIERDVDCIRIYQSELAQYTPPQVQVQIAACAATTLIGGPATLSGNYADKCRQAYHWAECVEGVFQGVVRRGSILNVEYVMPLKSDFAIEDTTFIQSETMNLINHGNRIMVIPTRNIPYLESVVPAIRLIKGGRLADFRKVVAAEAYLRLLIDGRPNKVYMPVLSAALGMPIEEALEGRGVMILPASQHFDSVTWDDLQIDKLARPIAYFYKVSYDTALQMLTYFRAKDPTCFLPNDKRHGQFVIGMLKILLSIETSVDPQEGWQAEYHQKKGQLVGYINPEMLADLLLRDLPENSESTVRILACDFVKSYLHRTFTQPNITTDVNKKLSDFIQEYLTVFPHSVPNAEEDRGDRWWHVGVDPYTEVLQATGVWLNEKLPISMEQIRPLVGKTINTAMVRTGWYLINRYLESPDDAFFRSGKIKAYVRAVWIVMLATAQDQIKSNNYAKYPCLEMREWHREMGNHLDEILARFEAWKVLFQKPYGADNRETLFTLYQVSKKMADRLTALEGRWASLGIIVLPKLNENVSLKKEVVPSSDGPHQAERYQHCLRPSQGKNAHGKKVTFKKTWNE